MFLIQEKRKNGTNLCIVQSYRDPVTKVSKTRRVLNIGYLEDLKKEYDDPVQHFKLVAQRMTEDRLNEVKPAQISLDFTKPLSPGDNLVKNYGYAVLSSLYHDLKLDAFFRGRQRDLDIGYNLNSIMKLLVYCHILYHKSINHSYRKKDAFFDKMEFSLDDIYNSFSYYHRYKSQLQSWTRQQISENYGQDTSKKFYYITNHYFEVSEQDKLHKDGSFRERRLDPIVHMGLFVDQNGFPASYDIFQRNLGVRYIFNDALKKARGEYDAKRIIVVTDYGTSNAKNLYFLVSKGHGYVICQSIRSAEQDIKNYVLSSEGYEPFDSHCKVKSRIFNRDVRVTTEDGKKKNVTLKERLIVFHNDTYERWAKSEREEVLLKAKDLIASPGKYNKATVYGAAKYVKNIEYDAATGEILQNRHLLHFDNEGLKEEEKYDGYYMILTSEIDTDIGDIMHIYNGLWEVEDYFKVNDASFQARPDNVKRVDYMNSHFTTCFVSLLLTRLLEMKTNNKYSIHDMVSSMKKCNYVHLQDNLYAQCYYDSVLEYIGSCLGIDFSLRYGTLSKIKENIGFTKKK